jgi:hypothetical protein
VALTLGNRGRHIAYHDLSGRSAKKKEKRLKDIGGELSSSGCG